MMNRTVMKHFRAGVNIDTFFIGIVLFKIILANADVESTVCDFSTS